jgi:large repetitive protein
VKYNQSVKGIRRHLLTVLLLLSSNLLFVEPAQASLFAFTSHTFTPCSANGTAGPSLANCISAYSSSSFEDNVSYFNVSSGIQIWTVPTSGSYTINAAGAKGGRGYQGVGGTGASITGTFSLTQGAKLRILVGQSGTDNAGLNGGGGGGSFVQNNDDSNATGILVIAGGGGGGGYNSNGTNVNAVTTNASQPGWNGSSNTSLANPASSGNGGSVFDRSGGGGGGFSGNGASSNVATCNNSCGVGGTAFKNGGAGGPGSYAGGFGGGASGDWNYWTGAGGGGGYSGGSGGYFYGSGGGGGSYNSGTSQTNLAASNNATGFVTISLTSTPDTTAPTFTSSTSFSAAENIATSVTVATIRVSESATVTISSGADAARFNIARSETNTAIIKFNVSPDFEAPADVGGNNVYEITLTATDTAANAGTQSITITVTDVVDTSGFNSLALAGSATSATYRTVVVITANVTVASKVTFRVNGKILPGCKNRSTTGSSPNIVATCSWRPSNRGVVSLTASAAPTGAGISSATANPVSIRVGNRTGVR